ncbi:MULTISPECIES: integrase arm-type DNA-binding domain-containing protein [Acinetobacter]|uniref:tyrosine-type recombinase/integrase n=1 Tax=Acinetobacter TaxID=469 RepID=UPI00132FDA39|nr:MULTISPECIES: integrase arm-type DNA-binding domain-containing protein [Acinetobacter]MDM1342589.1 tyrosine-type recombinase/integrase [Acinetobacter pseudolwoffii]UBX53925.1 tyrosine-type recombinase/integrase [Acinetobacter pseudolwoffii]
MSLTEIKVRQAKPKEKVYFLADDDGLSLKIEPNGRKSWSYRYSLVGTNKRPRMKLGEYPVMSLKEARSVRDEYKFNDYQNKLLHKKDIKTFQDICEEWLEFKIKNSFEDEPRCGVIQLAKKCLDQDIYPNIGLTPFIEVKRYDLVKVIKNIESRNVKEPVKKAYSYLNQIYDYAVAMGYCEYNIANGLHKILVNNKIKKNYPHLNSDELSNFLARLNQINTDPIIKKALLFKLYTGVRGGELLLSEPHHFDLDKRIWKIPALHIKQYRRKVILGHDIPDFLVPLSDQALEVVKSALAWSHGEKYVFSSPRNNHKPIHFNTLNLIIRKMGYTKNELSSHGLRSTFSTILNESGLFQSNWIEAQLSHTDKNKTRASYNHAEYFNQRVEMMQWWGDFIDSCTV